MIITNNIGGHVRLKEKEKNRVNAIAEYLEINSVKDLLIFLVDNATETLEGDSGVNLVDDYMKRRRVYERRRLTLSERTKIEKK